MENINISKKSSDELWNDIQGIIPIEYLNHWLNTSEIKELRKLLKFYNKRKKLSFRDTLKLLNQNGYNIEEIKQSIGDENVGSVRISE